MSSITQLGSSGAFITAYCPNCSLAGRGGHAAGPRDTWDSAIVALAAVTLLFALLLALRCLVRPGEGSTTHVKWRILDDSAPPRPKA